MNATIFRTIGVAIATSVSVIFSFAQTAGPGGIDNNISLWLDAAQVTATNNTTVASWPDASGLGYNFNTGAGATYYSSIQNSKPAFYFNGTNQYFERAYTAGINTANTSIFVVSRVETSTDYKSPITSRNNDRGYMVYALPNNNQWEFWYGIGNGAHVYYNVGSGQATTNAWSIEQYTSTASAQGIYINNSSVATDNGAFKPNNSAATRVGAGNTDGGAAFFFKGYIGEVAMYSAIVSTTERNIIANTLAWKYSITLATNYALTSATSTYSNDAGGVGRTSASDLSTDNQAGIVRVFNLGTSLANNEYFFWGHDGGALSADGTNIPSATFLATPPSGTLGTYSVQRRLNRVWRAYERSSTGNTTGIDVGTTSISFDLSAVPGAKRIQDLVLIVDTDSDGSFVDETYTAGNSASGIFLANSYTGGVVTFTNVNMKNANNFTIGTLNSAQTPLPVTLLNLKADLNAEGQVNITWQTATEKNSRYFIVERSTDASAWTSVDTVAAAGNSASRLSYAAIDNDPHPGQQYYRLRTVDLDASFEYSSIISIRVPITFSVYPNPATHEVFIETDQGASLPLLLGDAQGLVRQVSPEHVDDHTWRLDTSALRPGVYILRLGARRARLVIL